MNQFGRMAWLMASVAALLAPGAGAQAGPGSAVQRTEPVKGEPYSAEAVTEIPQKTGADGTTVLRTVTRIYRDSEGRERREEALDPQTGRSPDPQRVPTVTITDQVAGAIFTLNVLQHTATRMPLPGAPRGISPNSGGGPSVQPTIQFTPATGVAGAGAQVPAVIIEQGNHVEVTGPGGLAGGPPRLPTPVRGPRVERLEPMMIEGVRAEGTRTIEPVSAPGADGTPAAESVSETWTSPELKVILLNRLTNPRGGGFTYRLTKISRAEPNHALFEVPADYMIQEMPGVFGGMVTGGVTIGVRPPQ